MNFLLNTIKQAQKNKKRIVLPEGTEKRTLQAANKAIANRIADIILIGDEIEINFLAEKYKLQYISQAKKINPLCHKNKELYALLLTELRKEKGMMIQEAIKLVENPLYLGPLMIKNKDADGEIAGARNTTGDVLRPALQIIKTVPDIHSISGAFFMLTHKSNHKIGDVLLFADCAVIPNPNAQELSEIAISSAKTFKKMLGSDPRVALLSFSSKGSASHQSIDKIIEALRIIRQRAPELAIDGELQADSAIVPFIAKNKAPKSSVAGMANILIFPDLASGNISYKLVERLGKIRAIGPILQGMSAPINDLSRGCSVDDIYIMIAICVNQAIQI